METFKPGDLVRCIDTDNWYNLALTVGNEYKVLDIQNKPPQIEIIDDDNQKSLYLLKRFILVRHPIDKKNTQKLSRINSIEL